MEASSASFYQTWRKVHDGPYLWTPGIGNTGPCLRPRRVPKSSKLGAAPRLHRLRQRLLRHRKLSYVCLDRVTDFVFAYLVLAKPEYAFVPDVRLVLAQLVSHLVLDGSDCIDFGIDTTLFDDCHNMSPSFSRALCACGFMCVYLDIGTRPRHRSQAR
jgi:hypothetical protein